MTHRCEHCLRPWVGIESYCPASLHSKICEYRVQGVLVTNPDDKFQIWSQLLDRKVQSWAERMSSW